MAQDALVGADGIPLSADILGRLLDASHDALYAAALDPVRMLYATPAFAQRMGLPQDFLSKGYYFSEYLTSVHPDDQARVAAIMAAIVASRSDDDLPENPACYRLRTPEDGWRVISDTYSILRNADGLPHTLIGNSRDISERSHAQQTLREREARFRLLAENSRDLFFSMRFPEVRYEFISPSVESLFGFTPQSFYNDPDTLLRCIAPAWREQVLAWIADIAQGRVAEHYEFQVLDKAGRLRWLNQRQVLVPTPDGKGTLLQGVATDVTALREAQQALADNEARFRSLAENSRDTFFSFRLPEGRYEFISANVVDLLGYTAQEFYADPSLFMRCVAPQWRETMVAWNAEIVQGRVRDKYEFEALDKQGRLHWIVERLVLVPAPDGQGMRLQGVVADITEERAAREALRESNARYALLAENVVDVIWTTDEHLRWTYLSPSAERLSGIPLAQLMAMRFDELFTPQSMVRIGELMVLRQQAATRQLPDEASRVELDFRHADGSLVPLEVLVRPMRGPDGAITGYCGTSRDITERRRAEQALLASERRFSELIRYSSDSITILDKDGTQAFVSEAVERMLGFKASELMGIPVIEEMIHPDDQEKVAAAFAVILKEGMGGAQYRHKHKNGSWVYLEAWGTNQLENPDIRGVVVNVRDITERRQAEAALRLSEARYALALKGANDGIWDWDMVNEQVYYSDRWKEIIGYAPDEIRHDVGEWISRIHPEDLDQVMAANQGCIRGEAPIFQVEYRLRHKDGSYRWIFGRGAALADASGQVVRMAGAHTDITGRKQAEEALFKSERLSRKLLESMHEGVWAVDANRRTTFVNERLCAMLGYASAELMNMSPTDVLEWPQRHVAKTQLSDLEAGYSGATDYVLIRKDGSRFPAHVVSSPVMEEQGRFEGLVCGVVDLTERARMEHELRRNQARFEALYELSRLTPATEHQLAAFTLREAIRLTDSSAGVLFFVSEDALQLVPKAWETARPMDEVRQMPSFPTTGALPWAMVVQSALPLLINDFTECAHLVPPGHPPVSRFLGVPALDASRPAAVLGLTGKDEPYTAEDTLHVTLLLDGMWREVRTRRDEERIRASLSEKEALLHEVHHRVKNNLQVISSLMDMAGRRLSSAEARGSLTELRGKVQAMSLIHAQLHGAGSDGGISLERFVRALFHQLREVYAGGLDLSLRLQLGDLNLSLDQAVPLGLALNETLTNVFKHACPPASEGTGRANRVEVRAERDAGGQVSIEIEDNGPGLPAGFEPDSADSLGLKLTRGLVRHQLRGELTFRDTAPGLCVCIRFQPHMAK